MNTERALRETSLSLSDRLLRLKEREGVSRVLGVIGGSDESQVSQTTAFLHELCVRLNNEMGKFAIACGGTKGGVPEIALNIGCLLDLPTIGVFPEAGSKYAAMDRIDLGIAVPGPIYGDVKWGSETPVLVSIPDAFMVVGGSWGTLAEISMIVKRNIGLAKKELPRLPVVVVAGTGGIERGLFNLREDLDGGSECIQIVNTAEEAAKILLSFWS